MRPQILDQISKLGWRWTRQHPDGTPIWKLWNIAAEMKFDYRQDCFVGKVQIGGQWRGWRGNDLNQITEYCKQGDKSLERMWG